MLRPGVWEVKAPSASAPLGRDSKEQAGRGWHSGSRPPRQSSGAPGSGPVAFQSPRGTFGRPRGMSAGLRGTFSQVPGTLHGRGGNFPRGKSSSRRLAERSPAAWECSAALGGRSGASAQRSPRCVNVPRRLANVPGGIGSVPRRSRSLLCRKRDLGYTSASRPGGSLGVPRDGETGRSALDAGSAR